MNAIKPSTRDKRRYICFKVNANLSKIQVEDSIFSRVKRWIGEKNFDLARIQLVSYENGLGIISCNHQQYLDVRMGIMLAKAEVFAASGMVKKAKQKIKDYEG
jgi:RNase P/RNase MRP subunit POP5